MNLNFSSFTLDIIFIVFVVVMVIIGVKRGCVSRLYDLMATIVSIIAAGFFSNRYASYIKLYQMDGFLLPIGNIINRILCFVIVFFLLKLIFFIIGIFLKPMLKNILHWIPFGSKIDVIGSILLSLVESMICYYLIGCCIIMPLFHNGSQTLKNSYCFPVIVNIMPSLYQPVTDLIDEGSLVDIYNGKLDKDNIETLTPYLIYFYDYEILDDEMMDHLIYEYGYQIYELNDTITMSEEDYMKIEEMLSSLDESYVRAILSKIEVQP